MTEKERLCFLTILRFEQFLRKRENGTLKWPSKNGAPVAIKDMSDKHIQNIINMLDNEHETMSGEMLFPDSGIANDAF